MHPVRDRPGMTSAPRCDATPDLFIARIVLGDLEEARKMAMQLGNNLCTAILKAETGERTVAPTKSRGTSQSRNESNRTSFFGEPHDESLLRYCIARSHLSNLHFASPGASPWQESLNHLQRFESFTGTITGFEASATTAMRSTSEELLKSAVASPPVEPPESQQIGPSPGSVAVRSAVTLWGSMLRCIADLIDQLVTGRSPLAAIAALYRGRIAMECHVRFLTASLETLNGNECRPKFQASSSDESKLNRFTSYAVLSAKFKNPVTSLLAEAYWSLWARAALLFSDVAWLYVPPASLAAAPSSFCDLPHVIEGAQLPNNNSPRAPVMARAAGSTGGARTDSGLESEGSSNFGGASTTAQRPSAHVGGRWTRFKRWLASKIPKALPPIPDPSADESSPFYVDHLPSSSGPFQQQSDPQTSRSSSPHHSDLPKASPNIGATHGNLPFDDFLRPVLADHGQSTLTKAIISVFSAARKLKSLRTVSLHLLFDSEQSAPYARDNAVFVSPPEYAAYAERRHGASAWVVGFSLPSVEHAIQRRELVARGVRALYSPNFSGFTLATGSGPSYLDLVCPTTPRQLPGLVVCVLDCIVQHTPSSSVVAGERRATKSSSTLGPFMEGQQQQLHSLVGSKLRQLAELWSHIEAFTTLQQTLSFSVDLRNIV